jgi:hypothetical protein
METNIMITPPKGLAVSPQLAFGQILLRHSSEQWSRKMRISKVKMVPKIRAITLPALNHRILRSMTRGDSARV